MSTVSREELEGVGVVATVEVTSFHDLLAYRPTVDEAKTVVIPSPACSLIDLPAIICFSEKKGYIYGPHAGLKSSAATAGASKQQGESKDSGEEEAGQSTGTEKRKVA